MKSILLLIIICVAGVLFAQPTTPKRPLVYGHELRDGQRVRFLAQRIDMDLGLSLKLPDHGLVWMQMEEPDVIYVMADGAMIECDPACGNVVRLRLRKK